MALSSANGMHVQPTHGIPKAQQGWRRERAALEPVETRPRFVDGRGVFLPRILAEAKRRLRVKSLRAEVANLHQDFLGTRRNGAREVRRTQKQGCWRFASVEGAVREPPLSR